MWRFGRRWSLYSSESLVVASKDGTTLDRDRDKTVSIDHITRALLISSKTEDLLSLFSLYAWGTEKEEAERWGGGDTTTMVSSPEGISPLSFVQQKPNDPTRHRSKH